MAATKVPACHARLLPDDLGGLEDGESANRRRASAAGCLGTRILPLAQFLNPEIKELLSSMVTLSA